MGACSMTLDRRPVDTCRHRRYGGRGDGVPSPTLRLPGLPRVNGVYVFARWRPCPRSAAVVSGVPRAAPQTQIKRSGLDLVPADPRTVPKRSSGRSCAAD